MTAPNGLTPSAGFAPAPLLTPELQPPLKIVPDKPMPGDKPEKPAADGVADPADRLPVPDVTAALTQMIIIRPDGLSIELTGVKLGRTRVRIFDPKNPKAKAFTALVQITPDEKYLNVMLRNRFPLANLAVSAAGDNFLFVDGVVDNPADVEAVEDLLKKFYSGGVVNNVKVAGVMQVQLEVVIARVDRTQLRQFGVNLLLNDQQRFFGTQVGSLLATPQVTLPVPGVTDAARVFQPIGPNQPPLTAASTVFFGVTSQSQALYGFVEALRQHNLAKVLANPTLVTYNGRQADFLVGGEQPIPVQGTITAPTVQFKAFGTRLTFLPHVLGQGRIRLDVVPEVSTTDFTNSVTVSGLQVPQFVVQRCTRRSSSRPARRSASVGSSRRRSRRSRRRCRSSASCRASGSCSAGSGTGRSSRNCWC